MKTKRLLALVLAGLMIFSVPACGSTKSLKDVVDSAKETTTAVAKNDNADSSADADNADTAQADDGNTEDAGSSAIDLGKQTIIDNEWCTITANSLQLSDEYGDMIMKVTVENKSDTDYTVTIQSSALNNLEVNPYTSQDLAAGKKANMNIEWYDADMEGINREEITDFELTFDVYDSEYNDIFIENVHVYPYGEDKAAVYERPAGEYDELLVDTDDIQIISVGIYEDDFWGEVVKYYITNKTDKTLYVSADNVSVNGFMMDPYWGCQIGPKHSAYSTMYWSKDDFSENDIQSIETMDMTLQVKDNDTYDDIYSETMTLNIK